MFEFVYLSDLKFNLNKSSLRPDISINLLYCINRVLFCRLCNLDFITLFQSFFQVIGKKRILTKTLVQPLPLKIIFFVNMKVNPWTILWERITFENIYSCNTISLSRHEQLCLIWLHFERYFSHHWPDDGRSISWNLA